MTPLKLSDVFISWAGLTLGIFLPLLFDEALMAERVMQTMRTSFDMAWALGFLYAAKRWLLK